MRLPSLAERREDIAELAAFFCAEACRRHGLPHLELSRGAMRAVESTEWPGNVRQLAHAIEAAAIRAAGDGDRQVERQHLSPTRCRPPASRRRPLTFQEATRRFQAGSCARRSTETEWNVVETARRLDLARSHVYNLIRAFGLTRGDQVRNRTEDPLVTIRLCLCLCLNSLLLSQSKPQARLGGSFSRQALEPQGRAAPFSGPSRHRAAP